MTSPQIFIGYSEEGFPVYASRFAEGHLIDMTANTTETVSVPSDAKYAFFYPQIDMNVRVAPGTTISLTASSTSQVKQNAQIILVKGFSDIAFQTDQSGKLKVEFYRGI